MERATMPALRQVKILALHSKPDAPGVDQATVEASQHLLQTFEEVFGDSMQDLASKKCLLSATEAQDWCVRGDMCFSKKGPTRGAEKVTVEIFVLWLFLAIGKTLWSHKEGVTGEGE